MLAITMTIGLLIMATMMAMLMTMLAMRMPTVLSVPMKNADDVQSLWVKTLYDRSLQLHKWWLMR